MHNLPQLFKLLILESKMEVKVKILQREPNFRVRNHCQGIALCFWIGYNLAMLFTEMLYQTEGLERISAQLSRHFNE